MFINMGTSKLTTCCNFPGFSLVTHIVNNLKRQQISLEAPDKVSYRQWGNFSIGGVHCSCRSAGNIEQTSTEGLLCNTEADSAALQREGTGSCLISKWRLKDEKNTYSRTCGRR